MVSIFMTTHFDILFQLIRLNKTYFNWDKILLHCIIDVIKFQRVKQDFLWTQGAFGGLRGLLVESWPRELLVHSWGLFFLQTGIPSFPHYFKNKSLPWTFLIHFLSEHHPINFVNKINSVTFIKNHNIVKLKFLSWNISGKWVVM